MVKVRILEIDDPAAPATVNMMMGMGSRIEASNSFGRFDDLDEPEFCEGQQSAVYGIEGNVRIPGDDRMIDFVRGGMTGESANRRENCDSLGGYFEAPYPKYLSDFVVILPISSYLHCVII